MIREETGLGIRDKNIIKKVSTWELEYLKIAIANFIASGGNTFKFLENGYNMAAAGELKAPQKKSSVSDKIKQHNAMISHGESYVDDIEYLNDIKDQMDLGIITKEQYLKEVKKLGYAR